jgi:FlaG/FlaF family flagellin (archaellin)
MKNQSGISALAAVIIIVLVILAAVIVFFVFGNLDKSGDQPSGELQVKDAKKAVAEWNVYRNDQFGFEFKFPGHATVDDTYLENQHAFSVSATSKNWNEGVLAVINHGNVGTMTLSEFVAENIKGQGESGVTVNEAKLNGYDSISVKGKNKSGYYLLHKLDVYEVFKTSGVTADEADKMFASFKFIGQ